MMRALGRRWKTHAPAVACFHLCAPLHFLPTFWFSLLSHYFPVSFLSWTDLSVFMAEVCPLQAQVCPVLRLLSASQCLELVNLTNV